MGTVKETRCQWASLRAGARFSNPDRVENVELEVEVEGGNQRVHYKKLELNQDDALVQFILAKRLHTRQSSWPTRARLVVIYRNEIRPLRTAMRTHLHDDEPHSVHLIEGGVALCRKFEFDKYFPHFSMNFEKVKP